MKLYKISNKIGEYLYDKSEMLAQGSDGYLSHAILLWIPIDKITGLDPEPRTWVDDDGREREFKRGRKITKPIEVMCQKDNDTFILYAGNHRLKQAKLNGQDRILAFVEVEGAKDPYDFVALARRYAY